MRERRGERQRTHQAGTGMPSFFSTACLMSPMVCSYLILPAVTALTSGPLSDSSKNWSETLQLAIPDIAGSFGIPLALLQQHEDLVAELCDGAAMRRCSAQGLSVRQPHDRGRHHIMAPYP